MEKFPAFWQYAKDDEKPNYDVENVEPISRFSITWKKAPCDGITK